MEDKEKIFIDLSKCSEEQRKHIFSLLPEPKFGNQHGITENHFKLHISEKSWWVINNREVRKKTEILYPDFVKLFEGGETDEKGQPMTYWGGLDAGCINQEDYKIITSFKSPNVIDQTVDHRISQLQADKEELLEALEKVRISLLLLPDEFSDEINSLIQKHKQ